MVNLITEHMDIWTTALMQKSNGGRGRRKNSNGQSLHGIKKLRELILELAVRGKLVPQDLDDEPASALIEKIKHERDQLIKDAKFKNIDDDSRVDSKAIFVIPKNWTWCRLNDIAAIARGGSPRPIKSFITNSPDGLNWIKIGDTDRNSRFIVSTEEKIKKEGLVKTRVVYPGDLILSNSMSYGFPYILKIEGCIHDGWLVIRTPEKLIDKMYMCYLFLSVHAKKSFDSAAAGAVVQNLNADKVRMLTVPLPPLAEQHRIVAKVDELMAICDQLEQQQTDTNATHQTLVEILLATLTNAADQKECAQAWQRIANHFDTLFTTEQNIDQLKQTILQLAVMGKLVPQDPNDEPASVLLKKIAKEKERLIKDGKIKKQKPLPKVSEDEKLFELPVGWEFIRLDGIVDITSGVTKGRKISGRACVTVPYLRVANVQRGFLELNLIKEIDIPEDELNKFKVFERDLLITEGGDWDKVGRAAIWRGEIPLIVHQNHIFKARCILKEQNEDWLGKYINSQLAREYFARSSKQTTNLASINKTQLRGCIIAIPPLNEQHRIVAKVDELMALCDTLKERLNDAQLTQIQLADAIVDHAVA